MQLLLKGVAEGASCCGVPCSCVQVVAMLGMLWLAETRTPLPGTCIQSHVADTKTPLHAHILVEILVHKSTIHCIEEK